VSLLDKLSGWIVWLVGGAGVLIGAWALWATAQRRQAAVARKAVTVPAIGHRQLVVAHEAVELAVAREDIETDRAELAAAATQSPSDRRSDRLAAALNSR